MEWRVGEQKRVRVEVKKEVESSQERAERLARAFCDLAEEYGQETARAVVDVLRTAQEQGQKVRGADVARVLEGKTTRTEFATHAHARMERLGILHGNAFDMDAFMQRKLGDLHGKDEAAFAASRADYLAHALGNEPVVLADQPDKGEKPLLYAPKYIDDALSPEAIRRADFHLPFWHLPDWTKTLTARAPGAVEQCSAVETAIAGVIYHPQFGDGYRDAHGRLQVRQEDGAFRPITADWLRTQKGMGFRTETGKGPVLDRPIETLAELAPRILERGLVRASDFQRRFTPHVSETTRVTPSGVVRIDGIGYSIGRAWADKNIRIDKITDSLACIVTLDADGVGTPTSVFPLRERTDVRVNKRPVGKSFTYEVGKDDVALQAFDRRTIGNTSTLEERAKTLSTLERYEKVLALENTLTQEGFSPRTLSPELFTQFSRSVLVADNAPLVEFAVKESGQPALEAAALLAKDKDFFVPTLKAFTFLENERPDIAEMLLAEIQERASALRDIANALASEYIDQKTARALQFAVNTRYNGMLTIVQDAKKDTSGVHGGDNLTRLLAAHHANLRMLATTLRTAFKGERRIAFESLPGFAFSQETAQTLALDDLNAMEDILTHNWSEQKPEAVTKLSASLRERAQNPAITYSILKKDGKIIAFVSFDTNHPDAPDGVYVDAFNIDPILRDSGIGRAFIQEALDTVPHNTHIVAHANPDSPVLGMYVNEFHLALVGVDDEQLGTTTASWVRLERMPENESRQSLRSLRIPQDALVATLRKLEKRNERVQRIDRGTDGVLTLTVAPRSTTQAMQ